MWGRTPSSSQDIDKAKEELAEHPELFYTGKMLLLKN
jgi:hypothetical protein